MGPTQTFVRFESAVPNSHGSHPGIFAMLRGLRQSGRLTASDEDAAAALVERSYALHDEPTAHHFDTQPRALSWFRCSDGARMASLTELADDVVALLGRYGIACREVRSATPGRVTFSDEVQVVAVPATSDDWPF